MSMGFSFQFEQAVLNQSRSRHLLEPEDRVLVAVSGGPDSVALLSCLCEIRSAVQGLRLGVVHIHHGLRGDEANEDVEFVERLSQTLNLPCFLRRVPVLECYQEQKGESLQAVARRERYRMFVEVAEKFHATKVALGHTQDDQAETVIMWMLRGAGTTGLAGISAHRSPFFIRPFLGVDRPQILEYLAHKGVSFRLDSSNAKPDYLRNRIRKELIPMLKQFNPNIVEVLSRQSSILRGETQYLDQVAEKALEAVKSEERGGKIVIDRGEFLKIPRPIGRRVMMKIFRILVSGDQNPPFEVVESLMNLTQQNKSGRLLRYKGLEVVRDYDFVRFAPLHEEISLKSSWEGVSFSVPGSVLWSCTNQRLVATLVPSRASFSHSGPLEAKFDADQFSHALAVRPWKPGDVFFPFGLGGKRKKIQDFFSDIKLPRSRRSQVPILVAPEGILWVGGYRSDHRFRVTERTTRVLSVKICEE